MNFYQKVFRYGLSKVTKGTLTVSEQFSGGTQYSLGGQKPGLAVRIRVLNKEFYKHCVLYGEVGFGEAYIAQYWDSPHLVQALRWFAQNARQMPSFTGSVGTTALMNMLGAINRIKHSFRANTLSNSRRNISEHYDIGNDLYEIMLGKSMSYSCGVFSDPKESLDKAQVRKFELLCQKLQLKKSDHLLEIGTGWGSFAVYAAKKCGCKITSVTISEQQYNYALELIRHENLHKQIDVQITDYRKLTGKYDKIVSIEMVEAVGFKYFDTYFKKCAQLLKEDGLLALQYITFPESRFEQYLKNTDFAQLYIFPGSCLMSNLEVMKSMHRTSDLLLQDLETIGLHYTTTLRKWRQNIEDNRAKILKLQYNEEFLRKWIYYLAFCEAGFAERAISDVQVVFAHANITAYGDYRHGDSPYVGG